MHGNREYILERLKKKNIKHDPPYGERREGDPSVYSSIPVCLCHSLFLYIYR